MKQLEFRIKGIMYLTFIALFLWLYSIFYIPVYARITPEDILSAKQTEYQKQLKTYSESNQQFLQKFEIKLQDLNKRLTAELSQKMEIQAAILDEYERRSQGKNQIAIEKSRYWITFAHEAVAYQAAKIYIFNLTSESRIKPDIQNSLNLLKSEIESTRQKVIKSQDILEGVIKK